MTFWRDGVKTYVGRKKDCGSSRCPGSEKYRPPRRRNAAGEHGVLDDGKKSDRWCWVTRTDNAQDRRPGLPAKMRSTSEDQTAWAMTGHIP